MCPYPVADAIPQNTFRFSHFGTSRSQLQQLLAPSSSQYPKCQNTEPRNAWSSAPNWDQWLIASPDPTACVFSGFHGSRVLNSYPLHSSSFREFPQNLDRSPRILLLDGHDHFGISWVKSPDSFPLYLPVAEMSK
jgi:hypothetical protein